MQWVISVALAIHAFFCFFEPLLPQPIASASLSPSGTWQLLWRDGDTADKTAYNAWSIPAVLMPIAESLDATH